MAMTDAERKREQRKREKEAMKKYGGKRISFIAYGGTLAKLEAICEEQGFTGKQKLGEALTFLAESHNCDLSR